MGQKVNPTGLRLGVNRTWDSRWYADEKFSDYLLEDLNIKKFLKEKLAQAGISKIVIERPAKKARVTIHSARPGVVIGKKGQDIENLRKEIQKLTDSEVQLNILEVRKPELDAQLVADSVAQQLERRVAFRRAMKRVMQSALRLGAEGIKVSCSGLWVCVYVCTCAHVWVVLKSLVPSIIVKVVCLCILCVLTLIMQPQQLTQLMVPAALKFGSIKAKLWLMIQWLRTKSWLNKNNGLV